MHRAINSVALILLPSFPSVAFPASRFTLSLDGPRRNPPPHLRAPQPVAVLLARSGPEVVDEVEEVQQGVAAAGEPGLTGAAGVSRRAFDL